jgi:multiple sugar transport system substrate-binding protein
LKKYLRILILFLAVLAACSHLPAVNLLPGEDTPTVQPTVVIPTLTPQPQFTHVPTRPVSLRIWLPPEFDPSADNDAARLFKARLDEFQQRRDVHIDIRIKGMEGDGSMLNMLTSTSSAAPLALPDATLMPRSILEKAVLKGLLFSFDEYNLPLKNPDWYDYARQLATIQGSTYGVPFVGDALVLIYRQKIIGKPPHTWDSVLSASYPILFPAGEQDSLFTVSQYLSNGGTLQDADGRPVLDQTTLVKVFSFYEQALKDQQMPYWLTQYESDAQSYQAFLDNRSPIAITWASHYLKDPTADISIALPPTANGDDFCIVTGWDWTITSPDPARRTLAAELVQFLTASEFTASWSEKAGYIPTQKSALQSWKNESARSLITPIIAAAHLPPSSDILTVISPILKETTIQVLKNQNGAQKAAQIAVDKMKSP